MQDFFRCQAGFEDRVALVASKECKKLVKDLHYEARVQAVIRYNVVFLGTKVIKADTRKMMLNKR
jgi:hypothetical protein